MLLVQILSNTIRARSTNDSVHLHIHLFPSHVNIKRLACTEKLPPVRYCKPFVSEVTFVLVNIKLLKFHLSKYFKVIKSL